MFLTPPDPAQTPRIFAKSDGKKQLPPPVACSKVAGGGGLGWVGLGGVVAGGWLAGWLVAWCMVHDGKTFGFDKIKPSSRSNTVYPATMNVLPSYC